MKIGDQIAGHEIVAKLSSGGMATLYLGRKQGAGGFAKHVAIKVVHAHLAEDPSFIEMFLDEARLSARIDHPNVVHVHDLGEHEGDYFMLMEFVAGCSLAQLLKALAKKKLKLAPEVAVAIAIKVASALHAAHELTDSHGKNLGVVHRDVSPQNVLLAFKGHVKLIDFGIAKAADRSQQTQGAVFKGKIRYAAPEQAMGKPLDRRADVYAVGILLWEMLTTHRLFDGDSDFEVLEQVRNPNVRPPGTVVPGISTALDRAVIDTLHQDPAKRPQTADDLRKRLSQACPGALEIDSPHLADLLGVLMQEFVEAETKKLSSLSTISQILGSATPSPNAAELVERLVGPIGGHNLQTGSNAPTSVPRLVHNSPSGGGTRASGPQVVPPQRRISGQLLPNAMAEHGALALDQRTELSPLPFPLEGEASKVKPSPIRDDELDFDVDASGDLNPVTGGMMSGALQPGSQYPKASPYLQSQQQKRSPVGVVFAVLGVAAAGAAIWFALSSRPHPHATQIAAPIPTAPTTIIEAIAPTPVEVPAVIPTPAATDVVPVEPAIAGNGATEPHESGHSHRDRGSRNNAAPTTNASSREGSRASTQVRGRFGQRQNIVGPDDL